MMHIVAETMVAAGDYLDLRLVETGADSVEHSTCSDAVLVTIDDERRTLETACYGRYVHTLDCSVTGKRFLAHGFGLKLSATALVDDLALGAALITAVTSRRVSNKNLLFIQSDFKI